MTSNLDEILDDLFHARGNYGPGQFPIRPPRLTPVACSRDPLPLPSLARTGCAALPPAAGPEGVIPRCGQGCPRGVRGGLRPAFRAPLVQAGAPRLGRP